MVLAVVLSFQVCTDTIGLLITQHVQIYQATRLKSQGQPGNPISFGGYQVWIVFLLSKARVRYSPGAICGPFSFLIWPTQSAEII